MSSLLGRTSSTNRFRRGSLASAGVALAGVSSPAGATIISETGLNLSPTTSFSFDGTDNGELELFSMSSMHLDLGLKDGMHSSVQLVSWTGDGMMMGELANLSPGASVDGTLSYYEDSNIVHHDVITAPWVPGTTGYAGFTFDEGGTTPVYGWMQISFDSGGETFTVEQWAYEDSGAPIQVAAIPEPSTMLLLTAGFAGLAATRLRKRRRMADSQ